MKKIAVIAIQHPTEPGLFLHGLRVDNQKFACPGGHCHPGETEHESATRELEEETGLKGIKLDKVHDKVYGDNHVVLFHGVHPGNQDPHSQDDPDKEFVTFKFLDPNTHANLHVPRKNNIVTDWIQQSLQKDQPVLKLPKVPDVPNRLDQEVRPLPSGQTAAARRQKKIAAKSYVARIQHSTGRPRSPQHEAATTKFVNGIANAWQHKVAGKRAQPGAVSVPQFGTSGEPRYAEQAGFYSTEFQNMHPGRSIQEHEAAHMLMNHVARRYGEDSKDKLIDHVLAHFHVDDRNAMYRTLTGSRSYAHSPAIKEEMMNHMRDYLADPIRRNYLNEKAKKQGAVLDHNRMKTSWKNATAYLKNVTPAWLRSSDTEHHAIQQKANQLKSSIAHQQPEKLAASVGKITVEPFVVDKASFNPRKHDFIVRYQHRGKHVGSLYVTHKKDGLMPFEFQVKPSMQRKGIGSAMAQHAQKLSGKRIIRSPDMTDAGRAFAEKFIGPSKPIRKDEQAPMQAPIPLILQIPISLHGKTTKMTIKNFGDMNQIDHASIRNVIDGQKFHEPIDDKKMIFKPHVLKGVDGKEMHILLVYGAPAKIMNMKGSTPYIPIDKEDYDKFSKLGPAITSQAAGIKFHPAELKAGDQVLKTY